MGHISSIVMAFAKTVNYGEWIIIIDKLLCILQQNWKI